MFSLYSESYKIVLSIDKIVLHKYIYYCSFQSENVFLKTILKEIWVHNVRLEYDFELTSHIILKLDLIWKPLLSVLDSEWSLLL